MNDQNNTLHGCRTVCRQSTWWRNKWMGLVAGLWVMSAAGLSFNFSVYSNEIKALYYSQEQLDMIATASNIGNNVGLFAGIVSEILPAWALLWCGAMMNFGGYGVLWLATAKLIPPLPFYQIFFYQWLAPTGATFMDTAALIVCVGNIPNSRGSIVGLLIGMIGLSGAIYAQFYEATVAPNGASFLLLAAVIPTIAVLISIPLLVPISPGNQSITKGKSEEIFNINLCFSICFGLAIYLGVYTAAEANIKISRMSNIIIALGVVVWLSLPLLIPLKMYLFPNFGKSLFEGNWSSSKKEKKEEYKNNDVISPEVISDEPKRKSGGRNEPKPEDSELTRVESSLDELTCWEALSTSEFWLLFASMLFGVGSTATVINNLDAVAEALNYKQPSIFVSVVSIANFMGRVIAGFFSDYQLSKQLLPRSVFMAWSQGAMIVAYLFLAFPLRGTIYPCLFVIGFSLGATDSLVAAATSELFGLESFGLIYNVVTSAPALGSYLFATLLAGYVYDREAVYSADLNQEVCYGAHCFRLTFIMMAAVTIFGVIANYHLTQKTRDFYQRRFGKVYGKDNDNIESGEIPVSSV